jgi:hypothetical protein
MTFLRLFQWKYNPKEASETYLTAQSESPVLANASLTDAARPFGDKSAAPFFFAAFLLCQC